MASAKVIRVFEDQVCPHSNKLKLKSGSYSITRLFARYKPDPFICCAVACYSSQSQLRPLTTTLETRKDLQSVKNKKWTTTWCTKGGCGGMPPVIPPLAQRQLYVKLIDCRRKRATEGGIKGSGLYLEKSGSDGITSCFAATRTHLIPSYKLTHAGGGGTESVGFK